MGFRDSLSDDGNGVNLKANEWKGLTFFLFFFPFSAVTYLADDTGWWCIYLWVVHGLHGAIKSWTQRGKVDEHVHIWVLLHGVTHVLIHRDEDLFMAPVVLLFVVSPERQPRRTAFVTQWQDTVYFLLFYYIEWTIKIHSTDSRAK